MYHKNRLQFATQQHGTGLENKINFCSCRCCEDSNEKRSVPFHPIKKIEGSEKTNGMIQLSCEHYLEVFCSIL